MMKGIQVDSIVPPDAISRLANSCLTHTCATSAVSEIIIRIENLGLSIIDEHEQCTYVSNILDYQSIWQRAIHSHADISHFPF